MDLFRPSALVPRSILPRHFHMQPYAAVVLSGSYEEAGDAGRHRVTAGDVLLHVPFSAHCDRVARGATTVLNIPLPMIAATRAPLGKIRDPDALVRIAAKDTRAAATLLHEQLQTATDAAYDLPDRLAAALDSSEPPAIATWARQYGIARETLSRHFHAIYLIPPKRYAIEARARRAWRSIMTEPQASLAAIATHCGYADQAHMTRDVGMLTGRNPGAWRTIANTGSHSFKT